MEAKAQAPLRSGLVPINIMLEDLRYIEDDQGEAFLLGTHTLSPNEGYTLLKLRERAHPLLLLPEYHPYDDPPLLLWSLRRKQSLQDGFGHDGTPPDLSLLIQVIVNTLQFIADLETLSLLPQQVLWSPERVYFEQINAHEKPTPQVELAFICLPLHLPNSETTRSESAQDLLAWLMSGFLKHTKQWPENAKPPQELFTPPYNVPALLSSFQQLRPRKHRRNKHRSVRPLRRGTLLQTLQTQAQKLSPKQELFILTLLAFIHLVILVALLLLLQAIRVQFPDLAPAEVLGYFPQYLSPTVKTALSIAIALVLLADATVLLLQLTERQARGTSDKLGAPDTTDTHAYELSLQADEAIYTATLSVLPKHERSWRRLETRGLSKDGRAAITISDYYIGSDPTKADLVVKHPSIRPLHARIFQRQGFFYLTDLAQGGRTRLGGRTLVRYEDYPLSSNTTLQFGKLELLFTMAGDAETPPPAEAGGGA